MFNNTCLLTSVKSVYTILRHKRSGIMASLILISALDGGKQYSQLSVGHEVILTHTYGNINRKEFATIRDLFVTLRSVRVTVRS